MFWGNADELASRREMIKLFEAKNPDIKVVPQCVSDFDNKLIASVAGGMAPDVVNVCNDWWGMRARNGMFEDLTPYFAKEKSLRKEDFFPVAINTLSLKGRLYAIPYIAKIAHFAYNRDLLQSAGQSVPADDWTWTSMLEKAQKTTTAVGKKQFGLSGLNPLHAAWGFGGDLFDDSMTKCIASNSKVEKGLNFYMDLLDKYQVMSRDNPVFSTGRVPLSMIYSWDLQTFQKTIKTKFKWDIVGMPADPDTRRRTADCRIDGVSILKGSKHKEAAWRFVKFFASRDIQLQVAKVEGIPVLTKMAKSDEFEEVKAGFTDIDKSRLVAMLAYGKLQPFGGYFRVIEDAWNRQMSAMIGKKISPAQAMKVFEADSNGILKRKNALK
jgi:multiple sugar transport system substrate-binding protein